MTRENPPAPLVVVGASAGGVEALRAFVSVLPPDLEAAVLVVLHVSANAPSALPSILRRAGDLPARQAMDGDVPRAGEILVAPPDRHLVVADGGVTLTRGPKENGHRPAVDVLFRSAARARGPHVLAVVLSGALDDGAAGVTAVSARGGHVAVQDFDEALYASMPRAAAAAVAAADRMPVAELGARVQEWARSLPAPSPELDPRGTQMDQEVDMAELDPSAMHDLTRPGEPSGFGCPDCAGALFQIEEGSMVRYRCRVGHAWSSASLLARQSVDLEGALWMALRSLEEKAALTDDLAHRAGGEGHAQTASRFQESARDALHAAELVRKLIGEIGGVAAAVELAGQADEA